MLLLLEIMDGFCNCNSQVYLLDYYRHIYFFKNNAKNSLCCKKEVWSYLDIRFYKEIFLCKKSQATIHILIRRFIMYCIKRIDEAGERENLEILVTRETFFQLPNIGC